MRPAQRRQRIAQVMQGIEEHDHVVGAGAESGSVGHPEIDTWPVTRARRTANGPP